MCCGDAIPMPQQGPPVINPDAGAPYLPYDQILAGTIRLAHLLWRWAKR